MNQSRFNIVATGLTIAALAAMSSLVLVVGASTGASGIQNAPGTEAQVRALVNASHKIMKLPHTTSPSLTDAPNSTFGNLHPRTNPSCSTWSRCVFADTKSRQTVVLFGDSHARMWATSLIPELTKEKYRLVILWRGLCPATSISVFNPITNSVDRACNTWRGREISLIQHNHPALVLLSDSTERTATATRAISNLQWRTGLQRTITLLKSAKTKVAVIGDLIAFTYEVPGCLGAYPTKVQACAVKNPNPHQPGHQGAEKLAAAKENVAYIDPLPWLCTSTCSPVIGNMIVYADSNHLTSIYAQYLSGVMGVKVRTLLLNVH
jgi:hypothetical protein